MLSSPLSLYIHPTCPLRTSLFCVQLMEWLFWGWDFQRQLLGTSHVCATAPWVPGALILSPSTVTPTMVTPPPVTQIMPIGAWGRSGQRCTKCGFRPQGVYRLLWWRNHTRMKHPERRAWQGIINGLAWISSFFFLQCATWRKWRRRVEWQNGGQPREGG